MVGGTNYLSSINQISPPLPLIGSISIPYIVFYKGFNLPLKWAKSLNYPYFTYKYVSINPSGTHVAAVTTYDFTIVPNFYINIFQAADGGLLKAVSIGFNPDIL